MVPTYYCNRGGEEYDRDMAKKTIFETETCSRCGGCGRYSYCQMYGDTCFKCRGTGKTYTKRGQIARLYFEALCSLPAEKLEVGMEIWCDPSPFGGKGGWSRIDSIEPDALNPGMITVTTARMTLGTYPGSVSRVRQTPEQVAGKQSLAIIKQLSLTKSGKLDTKLQKLMSQIAWA